MTEWKAYTGSDEQIEEMLSSKNGFILTNHDHDDIVFIGAGAHEILDHLDKRSKYQPIRYLICNPHPLAEMTGQPVWVKVKIIFRSITTGVFTNTEVYETTTPDWNIPNADYSFTPFEQTER